MAADLKTIKEEITNLKSAGLEARGANVLNGKDPDIESVESAAIPPAPELDTKGYLAVLRRAFRVFLNCRQLTAPTTDTSASTSGVLAEMQDKSIPPAEIANDEALKKGCQALSMYARKVLDNPTQPRYRKISISNASFKNLVQPLKGHVEVLSAIGFIATVTATPCFEWTWYFDFSEDGNSASATTTVTRRGKPDASGVKDILEECIRFLDICSTQGLSSLEKELDKYDIVPAIPDTSKEPEEEAISVSALPTETTMNLKISDAESSNNSSSSSCTNHTKSDNGNADSCKELEKSSNAVAELHVEAGTNAAELSVAGVVEKISNTQSDDVPPLNGPPIPKEIQALLFSDVSTLFFIIFLHSFFACRHHLTSYLNFTLLKCVLQIMKFVSKPPA